MMERLNAMLRMPLEMSQLTKFVFVLTFVASVRVCDRIRVFVTRYP